jgi:alpha-ketoglutarate-dependent sulfate ester dioxygenase
MADTVSSRNIDLEVVPVAGRIGAEVKDVRLSPELDRETFDALYQKLLHYKVLFFRGQQHLDDATQEGFARLFGALYAHPTVPVKSGTDTILELDSSNGGGRANNWHTDVTFVDAYPKASILRAVVVPQTGGDTVWANTASAYRDLPEELRYLADHLWALHTNEFDYAASYASASTLAENEDAVRRAQIFSSTVYRTEHPVVHVHPETGECHLLLGGFVRKFVGYSASDSARLFSLFQDHITRLENTVRWQL